MVKSKDNVSEKLELIKRNTVEIIQEDELITLMKEKKQPVVYCGYEPNGPMHLGHFVTVLKLADMVFQRSYSNDKSAYLSLPLSVFG